MYQSVIFSCRSNNAIWNTRPFVDIHKTIWNNLSTLMLWYQQMLSQLRPGVLIWDLRNVNGCKYRVENASHASVERVRCYVICHNAGMGGTKAPSVNFSVRDIFPIWLKYLLDPLNHIYIWQVTPVKYKRATRWVNRQCFDCKKWGK